MKLLERTKRKIREAEQHLELLKVSQTADELEGHLAAFAATARTITFALQKDLKGEVGFDGWYKSKQDEMRSDPLCKFFKDLRDKDSHTGDSHIESFTFINGPVDSKNWPNMPPNSSIRITPRGVYWVLNSGTPEEKEIPVNVPKRINPSMFPNPPTEHLGKQIQDLSISGLCELYLEYLRSIFKDAVRKFSTKTKRNSR